MENNFLPETTHISNYSALNGKRVLIRLDLNVPIDANGKILNTNRINSTMETLKLLSTNGAKTIIISHLGENKQSLSIVAEYMSAMIPFFNFENALDENIIKNRVDNLTNGDILLLENVRMFDGEVENTKEFSIFLASLGDIYINNAFSVSHRKHASVVGVAEYLLSYFGPLFEKEVNNLSKVLKPKHPSLLILGGAKISTKLPLIKHYLDLNVFVFVGGAMVHNIFLAKGYKIGDSLFDKEYDVPDSVLNHPNLIMPTDVITDDGEIYELDNIPSDKKIVDCGKKTIENLQKRISSMNTVIMNGPVGLYEEGFKYGTEMLLTTISSQKNVFSVVGGGDTVTVLDSMPEKLDFNFISLGGGAMLDFLANGTLPGIEAVIHRDIK